MMKRELWSGVAFVGLFVGGIFALSSAVSSAIRDTVQVESESHASPVVERTAIGDR